MTDIQTMDYYVWPRHLYSHSRTCTRSGLCRRPSRLVASLICYLLDHAVFMRFQLSWIDSSICQTFPAIMEILIYYISSVFMEIMILCISSSWRFWSIYIVRGNDHTCHILYHAFSWPLYSYVSGTTICTCSLVLYYLMVGSSTWFFITPLLGWTYNVLRPSYHPSDLTH